MAESPSFSEAERSESLERFRNQIFVFNGQINPDLEKVSQRNELENRTNLFLTNYSDSTFGLNIADLDDWDLTEMHEMLTKCLHHLKRLEYDTDIIAKFEGQLEEVNIALNKKDIETVLRQ